MGLQFTPNTAQTGTALTPEPQNAPREDIMEVKEYDIVSQRQQMQETLVNSQEIDDIVSSINVNDTQSIVSFGAEAAEGISRCSDSILNSVNMNQINDSGKMLETLGTIMDKFDIQEIAAEEKKGLFSKMFNNLQKQLDKILAKYHTMGEEVDKIYVQLKSYEAEINESNRKLEEMFVANVDYYQRLIKYILAGEQGLKEIDQYLEDMRKQYEANQDQMLYLDINNLEQVRTLLDQRVQDLRISENVAMQSVPMIKSMQFGNLNLIRKINSAFIITLPVFKQALTQAVLLKRQRIQADAMQALDDRTNEMLLKNAQNTAEQSKLTTRLASSSSVKVETLEKTWQTIMQGITETKQIQEDARRKREVDAQKLGQMKQQYEQFMSGKQPTQQSAQQPRAGITGPASRQ